MLFTVNISLLRFRQRVWRICAERVCLALLCSLKAGGTREEKGDGGNENEREMGKERRGRKIKREIALVCL